MNKIKLNFGIIQKLKKYIKKYYILIILNILLATMSSLVSSAPIALIKRLFDKGISGKSEKDILYAAGAMIALAVIGAILMYWNTIFSTVISASIYKDIVTDIYNKIQTLDMEYFSGKKIGDMMTRVMTDPNNINSIILEVFNMVPEIIKVIICLGIAFYVDFDLTLGVMIVTPILVVTVRRYAKRLKRSGKDRQEAIDSLNSKLQETLAGIRIIRAFATERSEKKDFNQKNINLKRIQDAFNVSVYFGNKSHCLTLAERLFTYHSTDSNFIVYHVARGIHCSYMYNGSIYSQENFLIGEVGHTIINPEGERCPCGKNGCLQVYASESALINKASLLYHSSRVSLLRTLVADSSDINLNILLTAYKLGDLGSIELINTACKYLAISISNLCQLIDMERIYLDGEIFSYPIFAEQILSYLQHMVQLFPHQKQPEITIKPYSYLNVARAATSLCINAAFLNKKK